MYLYGFTVKARQKPFERNSTVVKLRCHLVLDSIEWPETSIRKSGVRTVRDAKLEVATFIWRSLESLVKRKWNPYFCQ